MRRREREAGVALLTVLLLVAVMSALAVGVLDDIRFALRRAHNAQSVGQAQWYALGAETLARARIRALLERDGGRVSLQGDWRGRPFVFPVEGGVIRARLADAGDCFNLNSLVSGGGDLLIADQQGVRQFALLAEAVGVPGGEAERLAAAAADWIDADGDTSPLGAEDEAYVRLPGPYRTAGTLMSEVSELRAVRGVTPEIYARLRPWLCALPTPEPTRLNIDTLSPDKALLLSVIYDGRLPTEAARRVLSARPANGWRDVAAFLEQPALAAYGPAPDISQITVGSRYFALDAEVDYAGAEVVLSALLEREASGAIRTVARRWTPDE